MQPTTPADEPGPTTMGSLRFLFAQAAETINNAAAAPVDWYQQGWFKVLVVLAILILPYMLGEWIGRRLRMSDYGWKIGLILVAFVAGITIDSIWRPRLGIDLRG